MTEQPSAEALNLVDRLRKPLHAHRTPTWHELNLLDAGRAIDALIARRVSAETERCAQIAEHSYHGTPLEIARAILRTSEPQRPAPEASFAARREEILTP